MVGVGEGGIGVDVLGGSSSSLGGLDGAVCRCVYNGICIGGGVGVLGGGRHLVWGRRIERGVLLAVVVIGTRVGGEGVIGTRVEGEGVVDVRVNVLGRGAAPATILHRARWLRGGCGGHLD